MAPRKEPATDFDLLLYFLFDDPKARQLLSHLGKACIKCKADLCRKIGLRHQQLTPGQQSELGPKPLGKIARYWEIPATDGSVCFKIMQAVLSISEEHAPTFLEDFEAAFHAHADEILSIPSSEQAPYTPLSPSAQLVGQRLNSQTKSIDPEQNVYIKLKLSEERSNDPARVAVDAIICCQTFYLLGVALNVRSGTLRVHCREELLPALEDRLAGAIGEVVFERKSNTVRITASGDDWMQWAVETDKAPIRVLADELRRLFTLTNARAGDIVTAEFFIRDSDLITVEAGLSIETVHELQFADDLASESVVTSQNTPLGPAKRQLLGHVAKLSLDLFNEHTHGMAILCQTALQLVDPDK